MSRRFPPAAVAALGGTAALFVLVGCAELEDVLGGAGRQGPRTVAYECDDDREFTARFSADREAVRIRTEDDKTYELELAGRRDGRRVYSDDDDEVHLTVGGGAAELRIPDRPDFKDCEARRA